MAWRCRECAEVFGGVNPDKCPVCGFTVLVPVEKEPQGGEETTEDFDVDNALDRLNDMRDQ